VPKIVLSSEGAVIQEAVLTKERTTLGRRPHNDVVVDDLSVSGDHAAFTLSGEGVLLEDLNSTNGTYVNGKSIQRHWLRHEDKIEIAKLTISFLEEGAPLGEADSPAIAARPMVSHPGGDGQTSHGLQACVKVLSGSAAGHEMPLTKLSTTIGKPGVAVAAITLRPVGFVVHQVDGSDQPTLNGVPFTSEPLPLQTGDVIEIAGIRLQFEQL
jgi:hypothetical protein